MNPSAPANWQLLERLAHRAMLERGLLPDFSTAASKQADALTGPAMPGASATSGASGASAIQDLRDLPWASIDNDDSRDLDQLSVSHPVAGGAVRILVAIADVDALVARGSPIDEHARNNTTSVYTVPRIFPMLPEKLSTDLTSLADGKDRLAVVIDMTIDGGGTLSASELYRAQVRNQAKLAYSSVGAWLAGTGPAPSRLAAVPGLDRQLRTQDEAAQALRGVRQAHGALTLQTIEARPIFDGGRLSDLRPQDKNRAQELIEDFMIAANGVTARFLGSHGSPSLRRVLRAPEKWPQIVARAAELGEPLPAAPSAPALNAFLVKRRRVDPQGFADLSLCIIKLLGRGEYVLDAPGQSAAGHFGLAVGDYTHSTAPNRRFPDLLTQRMVKAVLDGAPAPYSSHELSALALHCTAQEDNAAKVERRIAKSAAALLLAPRIGRLFDAVVTGAADKGTWARIGSPTTEGKVVNGFEGLAVGDRIKVKLLRVDIAQGFIDFERKR